MSYDNAEARHLTLQPEKHWQGYTAKPVVAVEWFETDVSQPYLERRIAELSRYFEGVSVKTVRPTYGGWRYEFRGVRRPENIHESWHWTLPEAYR